MPSADRTRLAAWLGLVGVLALLNYASRFVAQSSGEKSPLYTYSAAIGGLVQLAIILGVVLWIAHGKPLREWLALHRPRSWGSAVGISIGVLIGVFVLSAALQPLIHPGREQGLVPEHWRPEFAGAFAFNFVVVALCAPVVEELTFRGLGYTLLLRYGQWVAIVLVGVIFGLAHGLVEALPILVFFGMGLCYLRAKTDSVYPGMVVHAGFNALVLGIAVAT
jgi:membrane protease YdiL (CAAX protease family)